ncbi:MAG: glycosyltransferase family 4 protein [Deltaproteobacteria bacterium]|nr:glycosyltransferase family 4 protein [Deltaproteobacteria bacterium]
MQNNRSANPSLLLVTRNFPPLVGGMERLLFNVFKELGKSFSVSLVGPAGCGEHVQPGTPLAVCPHRPVWRFLLRCQWNTLLLAKRTNPHLVFSGSGVTVLAALIAGRLLKVPVVTYLHGLDIVADSIVYRSCFLPAIRKVDGIICNSRHTARLARDAGISAAVNILYPGVTLPVRVGPIGGGAFRERIGAMGRPILLSVGRLTPRKGIAEFVEKSLPAIVAVYPEVLHVIVGSEPKDAIGAGGGMRKRIMDTAKRLGLGGNILLLGNVDDQTLEKAYEAALVHVFPVIHQPGDVEGFGMVAVEAAAHGLPTVAFAQGGVVDAVRDGVSGVLVPEGHYEAMAEVILKYLRGGDAMPSRDSCIGFAEGFSWEIFGEKLRGICRGYLHGNPLRSHGWPGAGCGGRAEAAGRRK